MRVGRGGVSGIALLLFRIFSLFQSLCLAIQVEGHRPNSLVVGEIIFLKVWFNFRMNFLEISNDFSHAPYTPHPENSSLT